MDPSGRIPAVERPDWIQRPERWRYIPEGRLKPGNVLQRFGVSSAIVPFVFRSEDVGVGGGIAITDIDFRQRRRREFMGTFLSYSEEGQQSYTFAWRRWINHFDLPGGGVLQEERSFWRVTGGYRKTLTRRFFGFGPDTEDGDETSYTDQMGELELGVNRALPGPESDFVLKTSLRGEFHHLADGSVKGAPDTVDVFPRVFPDEDLGLGWLELGGRWDTRDSQRNPYRGWAVGADVRAALAQNHGDLGCVTTLFGTKVLPVPGLFHRGGNVQEENPPTDTLAFLLRTQLSSGDLPFFARPSLGGKNGLRGFIAGRWRDDASWLGVAEYRFWVIQRGFAITPSIRVERIGFALFYEAGSVASEGTALFRAQVHQSYGAGLRLTLERAAPFRVDVGFSSEDIVVSATFGLSF
jgi:hypothetical protein